MNSSLYPIGSPIQKTLISREMATMRKWSFVATIFLAITTCSIYAEETAERVWTFTSDLEKAAWMLKNVKTQKTTPDGLAVQTNQDFQMRINLKNVKTDDYGIVEIIMRANGDDVGQVFFSTRDDVISEKTAIRFQVKASAEFQTYRVNCRMNPLWRGQLTGLRIDPVQKAGIDLVIKSVRLLPLPLDWTFNSETKTVGWQLNSDCINPRFTADALAFTSGRDCNLTSPMLGFDAAGFKTVSVVMKADKSCRAQIFFTTLDHPKQSEQAVVSFPVAASTEWRDYRVDCSENPLWTGTVTRIRLDPVVTADKNVEIKSIQILP